jgi:hypothetical protein
VLMREEQRRCLFVICFKVCWWIIHALLGQAELGAVCEWVLQWTHTEVAVMGIKSPFPNCHLGSGWGNNLGVQETRDMSLSYRTCGRRAVIISYGLFSVLPVLQPVPQTIRCHFWAGSRLGPPQLHIQWEVFTPQFFPRG